MLPSRLQIAKSDILRAFDQRAAEGKHVFTTADLVGILDAQRDFWRLAKRTSLKVFTDFLIERAHLRKVVLSSEVMPLLVRYVWRDASPFEIALSMKPSAYLSHGSAVYLHGLNDQIPRVLYVNQEQTPKPVPPGEITQAALDRAFASGPRATKSVYQLDDHRVMLLNGKWSERIGVVRLESEGTTLDVTSVERTLIDIAVRPQHAGGPQQVLDAYIGARDRVSTNVLVSYLKKLDYKYPYSHAIGFYMTRAGYTESRTERLRSMLSGLDFYLDYGMKEPDYDPSWRVFIPRGFGRSA